MHNDKDESYPFLPEKIGFAVDLLVPPFYSNLPAFWDASLSTLIHLTDLLLVYETVLIRSDWWTVNLLYSTLSVDDLDPLVKNNRIIFFAGMNKSSCATPVLGCESGHADEKYFSDLYAAITPFGEDDTSHRSAPKEILNQIESSFIERQAIATKMAAHFQNELQKSLKPEFHELPTPRGEELYHWVGFRNGIGRILDIWSTGTLSVHIDPELRKYFQFCDLTKTDLLSNIGGDIGKPIDSIHTMHNIPTITELILSETLRKRDAIKLVLSDEARNLRQWLRANFKPNVDVRDCYFQALGKLPSKKSWSNWMRFGVISMLSAGISLVLSGSPELSAILGLSIGSGDVAIGHKMTEKLFDPYHPKQWVSTIEGRIST